MKTPRNCAIETRRSRCGYTLAELVVSMAAATVLMAGLGSSLFVATRAFDGNAPAMERSRAADVQEDLIVDLNQAKSFVTRDANSISFRVPDRNNDGGQETLSYSWTGLPDAELHYTINGSPPVTVLENVLQFNLSYMDRLLSGNQLPPLEPSEWGMRWSQSTFGYPNVYGPVPYGPNLTAAVEVHLNEPAKLKSLSAYLHAVGGQSDVRLAIYSSNSLTLPSRVLAVTDAVRVRDTGWVTLATPPISLSPGRYYLAISIRDSDRVALGAQVGSGRAYIMSHDATRHGFVDPWGSNSSSASAIGSIYGSYTRL